MLKFNCTESILLSKEQKCMHLIVLQKGAFCMIIFEMCFDIFMPIAGFKGQCILNHKVEL